MQVSQKIKQAIETSDFILPLVLSKGLGSWVGFTRTMFNQIAAIINKRISGLLISQPGLLESEVLIGAGKLSELLRKYGTKSTDDFIRHLSSKPHLRPINWISGKTLQGYWHGGHAKNMKIHVLLMFLGVPRNQWNQWLNPLHTPQRESTQHRPEVVSEFEAKNSPPLFHLPPKTNLDLIRRYYLGQYYLYYQKTDNSATIIKTPFVLKVGSDGDLVAQSVSEGHRYLGSVLAIRDGCLYIHCQNLDFEEVEQYIFNIGLETKPEVLFGVSNTVSVKNRLAVGLKNILVKQKGLDAHFENLPEVEIPFTQAHFMDPQEDLIVGYLKRSGPNVLITPNCCSLEDLKKLESILEI